MHGRSGSKSSPRQEAQAAFGQSLYERALDALPDGVLLTDANRRVVYSNQAFARLWGVPADLVHSRDETRMLQFVADQLVNPDEFVRAVERLHPTGQTTHDNIRFKDGRIFSRRSVPFERNGVFDTRIWIFTDITEAYYAEIDALTGVPNRRAYSRYFPAFVSAADDGFVRSVSLLDVDNFKRYNDQYGHAAGDAVLKQIGGILRGQLNNADDLLFRIGGEEFLLAVKSRGELEAVAFFDAIRRSIEAMMKPHLGNPPHGIVTGSFGVVTFREPQDPAETFARADKALYQAKERGRNIVVTPGC